MPMDVIIASLNNDADNAKKVLADIEDAPRFNDAWRVLLDAGSYEPLALYLRDHFLEYINNIVYSKVAGTKVDVLTKLKEDLGLLKEGRLKPTLWLTSDDMSITDDHGNCKLELGINELIDIIEHLPENETHILTLWM